jgi:16S rRNA (guanine966-N2)-methyltransferase
MPKKRNPAKKRADFSADRDVDIRIIGGEFRGRRLNYHGDQLVRPMKHRTREAIFDLIGTGCGGRHAIDLFAGTGALGLEALSRGSTSATFIERHVPTAQIIEQNIRILGVEGRTEVLVTSAFLWAKRDLETAARKAEHPWLVFCSPPYSFYTDRQDEMFDMIAGIRTSSPPESILVVEAEVPFDFSVLQDAEDPKNNADAWDVRTYQPAVVGIWESKRAD